MPELYPTLTQYIDQLPSITPPTKRQVLLSGLVDYLVQKKQEQSSVDLNFICTHNSRRSHLGQVWAKTLADHMGFPGLTTYSGGTEATACNPRTVQALRQAGFKVEPLTAGENPHYHLTYGESNTPMELWSKVYSDPHNPQKGFGAIMTCDSANEACPIVFGAEARFPIIYQDPKAFDDTPQEEAAYAERCLQIASEMYWVFQQVLKNKL